MKFIKVIGEKNKFNVKDQNYIQLNIPTAYYISYSINIITNSPIYKLSSFFILNKKIKGQKNIENRFLYLQICKRRQSYLCVLGTRRINDK